MTLIMLSRTSHEMMQYSYDVIVGPLGYIGFTSYIVYGIHCTLYNVVCVHCTLYNNIYCILRYFVVQVNSANIKFTFINRYTYNITAY